MKERAKCDHYTVESSGGGLPHEWRLWIGTKNGLAILNNGKFQEMTTAHALLAENVYSVTTTKDSGVWVGSFGGVAHIRQPALNNGIHLPPAPIDASLTASPSS